MVDQARSTFSLLVLSRLTCAFAFLRFASEGENLNNPTGQGGVNLMNRGALECLQAPPETSFGTQIPCVTPANSLQSYKLMLQLCQDSPFPPSRPQHQDLSVVVASPRTWQTPSMQSLLPGQVLD